MRAIFISYRRDDTEGYAGRLFQDLCERFGKESVFMDVAGIEPGRDFRRAIEQQVASCGVLLAVIGKSWLTVVDPQGQRRLDDVYDFVRLETASALKRDIPVIPVLVQQAEMPRAEQLPEDLKDLAFRNGVELSHARWESDVELLIAALTRYINPSAPTAAPTQPAATPSAPASRHPAWVIVPLATLALGGIGYAVLDRLIAGSDGTKETVAAGVRMNAASAAEPVQSTRVASVPAPLVSRDAAPAAAQGPVPVPVDPADRNAATVHPVAPPPASARRVERPAVAKAPAPAPAVAAARPPQATAPATTSPPLPISRAAEPSTTAPSPPALAAPAPAAAESPSPAVRLARREPSLDLLGSPGSASMVTRTIVIKPNTSYVNVTGGEVVRFEVGDKSFLWNFSGPGSSFDLARVAPASVLDHKVTAYVAPNPMYPRRP